MKYSKFWWVSIFLVFLLSTIYFIFTFPEEKHLKEGIYTVGIVATDDISQEEKEIVEDAVGAVFGDRSRFEVRYLSFPLEKPFYYRTPFTRQYSSFSYIYSLNDIREEQKLDFLIGITDSDLNTLFFNYVFGVSSSPQKGNRLNVLILSTFRMKDGADEGTYYERLKGLAIHELGHVVGLEHCNKDYCAMKYANSLEEYDIQNAKNIQYFLDSGDYFCNRDRERIQKNLEYGFVIDEFDYPRKTYFKLLSLLTPFLSNKGIAFSILVFVSALSVIIFHSWFNNETFKKSEEEI
jgi:archaemetzincin